MTTTPTALEVFMDFVVRSPDGTVDVSKIFSQECFQKWVETRKTYLKHPEQSFHRTLVCHVRGLERRAFPANVEAALLKLLRRKDINIWDNCFENSANVLHVGKFGFRHIGFHERPVQSEDGVQHSDSDGQAEGSDLQCESKGNVKIFHKARKSRVRKHHNINSGKKVIKDRKNFKNQNSLSSSTHIDTDFEPELDAFDDPDTFTSEDNENMIEFQAENDALLSFTVGNPFQETRLVADVFKRSCYGEDLSLDHIAGGDNDFASELPMTSNNKSPLLLMVEQLAGSMRSTDAAVSNTGNLSSGDLYSDSSRYIHEQICNCPWEALGKMLIQYKPESFMQDLEKMTANWGVNLFPPALVFLMKQRVPDQDPRFEYAFLFPKENECSFRDDPDRPIGQVLADSHYGILRDADPNAKMLLRRELSGEPMTTWIASLFEFWFGYIEYIPRLGTQKETWRRRCFRRGDGSVGLFLCRSTPIKLQKNKVVGLYKVEMQDISDLYPEILRRSFFI